jgi:Tol biopolymer transport system component
MIHRFVDLFDVGPSDPILPLMVTKASPDNTTELWLIGYGLTPVQFYVHSTSGGYRINDPKLSPDETTAVWGLTNGSSPFSGAILTRPVDLSSSATTVRSSMSIYTGSLSLSPCWSPDGTQIAFLEPPSTFGGNWGVGLMDANGSNYSNIYTVTGAAGQTLQGLSWSQSGTYLACKELNNPSGPNKVHILAASGSGGSVVYTSDTGTGNTVYAPAWQRSSDVLGFMDVTPVGTSNFRWYTINGDGTGQTTIFDDSSQAYEAPDRMSWLSDDSAMLGMKLTTGPNYELALIDGGGGGATDSGIDLGPLSAGGFLARNPFIPLLSGEDERLYYSTQNSSAQRTIESVLTDFTDNRTEWTYSDYASNYQHHGIFEYDAT